jgi:proline dehydrogenase
MLRKTILYLSDQPKIFRFVRRNRLARGFARRFVAGETINEALEVVRSVNAMGATASLDILGESVYEEHEARATMEEYLTLLDRIHAERLDSHVSLKLTALGLDVRKELCISNLSRIVERAATQDTFVRIDMEGSDYTEVTLEIFEQYMRPSFPGHVGIVLQSALRRTTQDVENAIESGARVRLCKGAYKEPASIAYPDKSDVDEAYVRQMKRLLEAGNYPGLATHDEAIIAEARRFVAEKGIGRDRFEFQMLYGIRRDLQEQLVRDGLNLRVYVPFGTQWYPYLMRRLAERPANLAFITGNIVREMVRGRR